MIIGYGARSDLKVITAGQIYHIPRLLQHVQGRGRFAIFIRASQSGIALRPEIVAIDLFLKVNKFGL